MTDRKAFFDVVRHRVFGGNINQSQVDGINTILDAWGAAGTFDPRFIAYALATAYWETDKTMKPVSEIGHGHGHSYSAPAGPWGQSYYGRGYVQLTWFANYDKAGRKLQALGVLTANENLAEHPDLALRPDVAAPIMVHGMLEGWFTGRRLGDFFHGAITDWTNARTIINGHDHAAEIAHYALGFYEGLLAQSYVDVKPMTPAAATEGLVFTPGENSQSPGIAPAFKTP